MFSFLKAKPQGKQVTLKISGMHCTSCAMNIDGELEDTPGVFSASTSYAKSTTQVNYNPQQVSKKDLIKAVKKAGYTATQV